MNRSEEPLGEQRDFPVKQGKAPLRDDPPSESPVDLRGLADEYGMELLTAVSDDILDASLVAKVPVEWSRANDLLPVRIRGELCVLTADPSQVSQQEYLNLLIGAELRPVLASRDQIAMGIERCYYRKEDSPGDFLRDLSAPAVGAGRERVRSDDLLQVAEKAPVTQLVNLILLEAVKRGSSDIHFEPFESRLRVRYRVDGVLYEQTALPKHMEDALISRLKIMSRMDIAERRLPQDGTARVRVGEREIDIRMSTIPVAEGERVVLRLLNRDAFLLPLSSLGMSEKILEPFRSLLVQPNGILIVSGPTGSGKTTTLYAALGQLDAVRRNIITIEDPIEYQIPNIGQIQVKPKIGLTFASGLRHILRQDPDIVLVGETRDFETAEIAVRASLTGHLVFTTLHTNDATSAVMRLVDMGVEPYLLAASLRGVLAQRLVRKLCPACRKSAVITERDIEGMSSIGGRVLGRDAWTAVGCPECLEGYRGRMGIFELMYVDRELQNLIRSGQASPGELRTAAEKKGMRGLLDDGLDKVFSGATSLSEIMSAVG